MSVLTDEQIADGWIAHDGGPCPVRANQRVEIMFRDAAWRTGPADLYKNYSGCGDFWRHKSIDRRDDIIAYKAAQ